MFFVGVFLFAGIARSFILGVLGIIILLIGLAYVYMSLRRPFSLCIMAENVLPAIVIQPAGSFPSIGGLRAVSVSGSAGDDALVMKKELGAVIIDAQKS